MVRVRVRIRHWLSRVVVTFLHISFSKQAHPPFHFFFLPSPYPSPFYSIWCRKPWPFSWQTTSIDSSWSMNTRQCLHLYDTSPVVATRRFQPLGGRTTDSKRRDRTPTPTTPSIGRWVHVPAQESANESTMAKWCFFRFCSVCLFLSSVVVLLLCVSCVFFVLR